MVRGSLLVVVLPLGAVVAVSEPQAAKMLVSKTKSSIKESRNVDFDVDICVLLGSVTIVIVNFSRRVSGGELSFCAPCLTGTAAHN